MAGGLIGLGSSIGAILSGQQRGQEQTDLYRQEIQARQLQQQLETQKLLQQLKEQNAEESALGSLPKEAQPYVRLGLGGEYMKRQQSIDAGRYTAAGYDALAAQEKDPNRAAAYRYAGVMARQAIPEAQIKDFLGRFGIDKPLRGLKTIYGPGGATQEVEASPGYTPPAGFSLKAPTESPSAKMMETPVGTIKGLNVITPTGEPWPNGTDTLSDALHAGGLVISDKAKDALAQSDAAQQGLSDILEAGKAVLPGEPGTMSAYLNPLSLGARRMGGDPKVADYDAAKITLIRHLRAVAGVSRVNQQELAQVNNALANANSYPALQAAVARARQALQQSRSYMVKAGRLSAPTDTPASNPGGRPADAIRLPSGMWYSPSTGRAYP